MLKIKQWHKFQVKKLFSATNTGNILARDVEDGTGFTPYVTASAFNNGVVAHIDASKYELIKGHCILVGGKTFTLTYQDEDFVSNDSHNFVLYLKENDKSSYVYLFLITAIRTSLCEKYKWADAVTKDKLLEDYIYLPINKDNDIDWEYMEDVIIETKTIVNESIDSLLLANSSSKPTLDLSQFKRFHLYDDQLFDIDSGTKLDKAKMTTKNPSVNFVGRANANNGVTDFIDKIEGIEPYKAGNLTISLGGEYLGSCFVQEKDFYTSQNVNVLIPKHEMTDNCKQYIATMIFREGRLHYKAFIDELNKHMKTDFSIPLPVTGEGQIDWCCMESYMTRINEIALKSFNGLSKLSV